MIESYFNWVFNPNSLSDFNWIQIQSDHSNSIEFGQNQSKMSNSIDFLIEFDFYDLLIDILNILCDLLINFFIENDQHLVNFIQISNHFLTQAIF